MDRDDAIAGYQILGRIGQGGFGTVYQAREERLDRVVALKVLSDTVDQRTAKRFQRECRLTSRLTGHPNVVTVLDTGMTRSGRPYIAMGLFEKGSLHDRLKAEGPLPVADVLRAGIKIAGALAAVHDAGVIHGDVKPQNLLVSRFGEPALADFGVARMVDLTEVSMSTYAVTPAHAAPELLNGKPHDKLTDIYGLGSTLYQLLAGRAPFHADSDAGIAQLVLRVMTEPPPVIPRTDLPPPIFEAICQAMAKRPEDRFPTPIAFAQRLQQLQAQHGMGVTDLLTEDQTVSAMPAPPPTALPQWVANTDPSAQAHPGAPVPGQSQATAPRPPIPAGPPQQSAPPEPPPPSGSAAKWILGIAAIVLTGAVVGGVALFFFRPGGGGASPSPTPSASPPKATPIDPEVIAGLRPTNLKAKDKGRSADLSWKLPEAAEDLALTVQVAPKISGQPPLIAVPERGAEQATVVGLNAKEKYCFRVWVFVRQGSPPTVAMSEPVCIRGGAPSFGG